MKIYYIISKTTRVKLLLLYLYLKTIGRVFVHIYARRNPYNEQILFARFMGKHAKRKMLKKKLNHEN